MPQSAGQKQLTGPTHTQEEGVTRGVNTRRWGFTGVIRSLSTPGPSGIQVPPAGNMHLPPLAFSTVSSHWKSGISSSEAKCGCGSSGSSRSPTTGAQFLPPGNLWDCCDQSPASAPVVARHRMAARHTPIQKGRTWAAPRSHCARHFTGLSLFKMTMVFSVLNQKCS